MNLYIAKEKSNFFIEKLKENEYIDDFILDKSNLIASKVTIKSTGDSYSIIKSLLKEVPVDSIITDQVNYPGNRYVLCTGETDQHGLEYLFQKNVLFSIVTKKETAIRLNIWVRVEAIEEIFLSQKINHFTGINGKIADVLYFYLEVKEKNHPELLTLLEESKIKWLNKGKKIYVAADISDFTRLIGKVEKYIDRLEILDKEDF